MSRKSPSVVLVGRPNVGKSTLFNRITGSRRAIVAPIAGTTRDALARPVVWRGVAVPTLRYRRAVRRERGSAARAGRRAGAAGHRRAPICWCLLVDGREGLVPGDERIARELRETGRPVLLAVNKTDDKRARRRRRWSSTSSGSSRSSRSPPSTGRASRELLDEIVQALGAAGLRPMPASRQPSTPSEARAPSPERPIKRPRVAIVGRPNVGKSSLVNRLLREERVLVSDMPGTTRDAIDAPLIWHRRHFRIVDTAGMRRPGRVAERRAGRAGQRRAARRRRSPTPTSWPS